MNPLTTFIAFLTGVVGLGVVGRSKSAPKPDATGPLDDTQPSPSQAHYFASFPGHRRAKSSEVTPEMRTEAIAALGRPIGATVWKGGYLIALEHHFTEAKGWHKGASVFMRES